MTDKELIEIEIAYFQEQIKVKQRKLKELEQTKTPCEEAFKDNYGVYPNELKTTDDFNCWKSFKRGYNAAYEEKASEWKPTPQTPEQVADGLREAFRETVKQGVVSSFTKPQTLSDLIYDWWEKVFGDTDDTETCIDHLVDEISLWLPTEHETNSYKWNECVRMIREKLR